MRKKRRPSGVIVEPSPYANSGGGLGMPPRGLPWISHGPDARLSRVGQRIFYAILLAIIAIGVVLVIVSR
jgi:hypothetical protein